MNQNNKNVRFLGTPYLFILVTLLIIGCLLAFACLIIPMSFDGTISQTNIVIGLSIVIVPFLILLAVLFIIRFEWCCFVEIQKERLLFKAFLTQRSLYYRDINHVGIDYGELGGGKQFWIYFSEDPVPMKYYHNITRLKFKKDCMSVQYSKKAYEALIANTPPKISGKLRNCYSVILLYKLDKDG